MHVHLHTHTHIHTHTHTHTHDVVKHTIMSEKTHRSVRTPVLYFTEPLTLHVKQRVAHCDGNSFSRSASASASACTREGDHNMLEQSRVDLYMQACTIGCHIVMLPQRHIYTTCRGEQSRLGLCLYVHCTLSPESPATMTVMSLT